MQVRVSLMRNAGRWLTWNQRPRQFEGVIYSRNVTKDDGAMTALGLLGDGKPSLYDPKIKDFSGTEIAIVGLERVESAWVLQEWKCEILSAP